MKKFLVTLLIIILVAVIGVGGYFLIQMNEKLDEQNKEIESLKVKTDTVNNEIGLEYDEDEKLTKESAVEIGETLYNYACDISFEYEFDETGNMSTVEVEGNTYKVINNYDEVMEKFTENGEKEICHNLNIISKDNEYLILDVGRGTDITYRGTELLAVDIYSDMIEFNAISSYSEFDEDGNEEESTTSKIEIFTIKLEDGIWKVETFTNPK